MPRKLLPPSEGTLTDTWGRANRTLPDFECLNCKRMFRPLRATSRYCSRQCMWANNGGRNKKSESWWVTGRGYVDGRIWENGQQRRVKRHRLVAEQALGRRLLPSEIVHHGDHDKQNNAPTNLIVVSNGEHTSHHNAARVHRRGYKLNLSDAERKARSKRMKAMRRAAIAKAMEG